MRKISRGNSATAFTGDTAMTAKQFVEAALVAVLFILATACGGGTDINPAGTDDGTGTSPDTTSGQTNGQDMPAAHLSSCFQSGERATCFVECEDCTDQSKWGIFPADEKVDNASMVAPWGTGDMPVINFPVPAVGTYRVWASRVKDGVAFGPRSNVSSLKINPPPVVQPADPCANVSCESNETCHEGACVANMEDPPVVEDDIAWLSATWPCSINERPEFQNPCTLPSPRHMRCDRGIGDVAVDDTDHLTLYHKMGFEYRWLSNVMRCGQQPAQ